MDFELFKETKTRYLFIKILFTLILGITILLVLSKLYKITITDNYIEIISFMITGIGFLLVLKFMRKNNISINRFVGKPYKKRFIFEFPVTLIVTYLGSIGLILVTLFLMYCISPNILDDLQSNLVSKPPKLTTAFITIVSFTGTVLLAPITEEFIFRGILMNRLYNKYGINKSIIYSSLVFFMIHMSINPMTLCLGISCGVLVYKYKSLIPSIALHSLNNLIVFIRDLNSKSSHTLADGFTINPSIFILGSILFIIYTLYVYISLRKCRI